METQNGDLSNGCLLKSFKKTEPAETGGHPATQKERPADSANCSVSIEEPVYNGHFDPVVTKGPSELKLADINYSVREWVGSWWKGCCCRPRRTKQVLKDINMYMQAGYITGILGNSGSGKTSLLDTIACRTAGTLSGKVLFNGHPMTEDLFRKVGGYVLQADRLLPNLTVLETLTYTASLKFPGLDKKLLKTRVEYALTEMGLRHVANERVGGTVVRGISGGEKRRLSIGTQLLQDSNVLLLDEPTSGLDSFSARSLIETLGDLAHRRNKIVLLTIHQPRSDIFKLFDHVCILSMGEVLYYGLKDQMVHYFGDIGYPCPTYVNPLDHYVDVASVDRRNDQNEESTIARITYLRQQYLQSQLYLDIKQEVDKNSGVPPKKDDTVPNKKPLFRFTHGVKRTPTILSRMYINIMRDRSGLIMRFTQIIIYSIFLWLYCWKLPDTLPEAIQNRTGLFYQCLSATAMVGVLNGVGNFPSLRNVYYRESGDGLYGCVSFLCAYYVHIMPFNIISSLGYSLLIYWGCGMYPDANRFGIFYALIIIQQYLGEILTVMCLGIFYKAAIAQAVVTLIFSYSIFCASGLFRTMSGMPDVFYYLAYGNFFKYTTEIMVANEYHDLVFTCTPESNDMCDVVTGDAYVEMLFPGAVENMDRNFGISVLFIVGVWLIVIMIFKVKGVRHLR